MMCSRRRDERAIEAAAIAAGRWAEAAQSVADRFDAFNGLSLDEAVETALLKAPGNMNREELTARIAASRGIDLTRV